jgi:hypothetical protein
MVDSVDLDRTQRLESEVKNINLVPSDIHHHHPDLLLVLVQSHLPVSQLPWQVWPDRKKRNRDEAMNREIPLGPIRLTLNNLPLVLSVLARQRAVKQDEQTTRLSVMEFREGLVPGRRAVFLLVRILVLLGGELTRLQLPRMLRRKRGLFSIKMRDR